MKKYLLGLLLCALLVVMVTACNRGNEVEEPADPVTTDEQPEPTPPVDDNGDDDDDDGWEAPVIEEVPVEEDGPYVGGLVSEPTAGRLLGVDGVPFNRAQILEVVAQHPAPAGQVVLGDSTRIAGNFIANFTTEATGNWVNDLLHSGRATMVMDFDGFWHLNPFVLREAPTIVNNADGTRTYTFYIYTDNVWSDGTPITAIDYVFNVLAFSSPAMQSIGATVSAGLWVDGYFEFLHGRRYEGEPTDAYGNVIGVSQVEDEEGNMVWVDADGEPVTGTPTNVFTGVRLHSEDSFSITIHSRGIPYVWDHTYQNWGPTPFHYWNQGGNMVITDTPQGVRIDGLTEEWVTERVNAPDGIRYQPTVFAGPYMINNWDAGAGNLVLERNPMFQGTWDGFMPQIQTIAMVNSPFEVIMDSLRIGHIDMVHAVRSGTNIGEGWNIVNDLGLHRGDDFPRHGYGYLAWHGDHGPGQFPEVRRSIAWLIDRYDFARQFTGGWGTVQHGPYALRGFEFQAVGFDLYNHPDFTHYGFNPANALQELINGGWVYNSEGNPFEPGVDAIRYKDVTDMNNWEGESLENDATVTILDDGRWMMRLEMIWAANDNDVSNIMRVVLPPEADAIGMRIIEELYPAGTTNIPAWQRAPGSAYAVGGERFRAHHIYTLAVGLPAPTRLWNQWSLYEAQRAPGFNTTWHGCWELHRLAWATRNIDASQPGWEDIYLGYWLEFQLRYNYWMPLLPLYADDDHDFVPLWLGDWESHGIWTFPFAVQRAYDGRTR